MGCWELLNKMSETKETNKEDTEDLPSAEKQEAPQTVPEEDPNTIEENEPKSGPSDKTLILVIFFLILVFIGVFGYVYFIRPEQTTISGLHTANINDELDPNQGRVYMGYSFVNIDGFWYTQLKSPKGTKLYDMSIRYPPWELEELRIEGYLNVELFDNSDGYFVTFNPTGNDFSNVAVAIGDFNEHMLKTFDKTPTAACDRNQTAACVGRPIVDCDSSGIVFYVKEAEENRIYYDDNCIVVEGSGLDLIKSVDRVLYNLYGMLGQ